jgi:hypothetical protein
MQDKHTKERLLARPYTDNELSLEVATREILAAENARGHLQKLSASVSTTSTFHVHSKTKGGGTYGNYDHRRNSAPSGAGLCTYCGYKNRHACPHRSNLCNYCIKIGHLEQVCYKRLLDVELGRVKRTSTNHDDSTSHHYNQYNNKKYNKKQPYYKKKIAAMTTHTVAQVPVIEEKPEVTYMTTLFPHAIIRSSPTANSRFNC